MHTHLNHITKVTYTCTELIAKYKCKMTYNEFQSSNTEKHSNDNMCNKTFVGYVHQ